jgi:LysR family transcriptional regulator for metE and metH
MGTPKAALDIRDLQLVLAIADAGTTVGAASVLHLTQSAVSRGLLLAEQKLGARLFDRSRRGLAPTAAGQRLIDGAPGVLTQLVELEAAARAPVAEPTRLRLVCECYTAYRWLPSALARLRRDVGSLEVELAVEHTAAPGVALREGSVDIALLTTGQVRAPLVEFPLFSDEIVLLLSRTHPLAKRRALERSDLTRHPLIISTQAPLPERRWFLKQVFGRAKPDAEFRELPLTEAIVDTARAGMGIAVLSEWIAGPYLEGGDLVARRLHGQPLRRPWRMACHRDADHVARRLAAALEHAPPRSRP